MIANPKSRLEVFSDGVMAINGTLCAAPASRQRKNTLAEHSQALLSLLADLLHRLLGYLCASSLVRGALRFVFFLCGLLFELLRRLIDQQHVKDPIMRAWHEQASTRDVLVLHGIW